MKIDDNTLEIAIDELFKDDDIDITKTESDDSNGNTDENKNDELDTLTTKAVSQRINEVKHKTESDTQERIAKELGYETYADLQKASEKKLMQEAGLDEDEISSVVEKLVEKRLANDTRLKKLEEYENREKENFVNSQLQEINKLTGNTFTKIEDLPKETLTLWEKTGNLKQAYLATEGEALLSKQKTVNNGSTAHMYEKGSSPASNGKKRLLTEEEKMIYRSVMPDITDEELSKKTVDI